MRVKCQLAEYELAQRRGEMITADDAEAEVNRVVDLLRAKILNMPGEAAPRIQNLRSNSQARGKLEDIVYELLETLRRTADEIELEDDSPAAEDPPTPKRGRRKRATKQRASALSSLLREVAHRRPSHCPSRGAIAVVAFLGGAFCLRSGESVSTLRCSGSTPPRWQNNSG